MGVCPYGGQPRGPAFQEAGKEEMVGRKTAHLEGRDKAARQQQRRMLGPLRNLTVQPATRERYDRALEKFRQFLKEESRQFSRDPGTLDLWLRQYIEVLWEGDEGRALAADTIAAVQDYLPAVKGKLATSWRLMKTWNTQEIPNRAPPLPEQAVLAMAGWGFFHGHFNFSVSILVCFYAMLRTGEVLGIRNSDIAMNSGTAPAVISLGLTKGGKRTGAAESVTLTAAVALKWLWLWKSQNGPRASLCPSASVWRKMFKSCLSDLSLSLFEFRPYSLRRGGSTFWFAKHGSLDRLLVAGRWQAARTARIYINEGLSVLAELHLPHKSLLPFARVFHSQSTPPEPAHLSARSRRRKGGRGKGGGQVYFSVFL